MQRLPRHILIGLLLLPLLLAGCGGGGGGGGGGTSATVSGQVLDSRSTPPDQPVQNARVEIGGASTTTGTDGTFTLRGVRIGSNTAVVTPPGGQPQTFGLSLPITQGVNVLPDPLILNIGQVRGTVLTPDGQPASNALVTVVATGDNVLTGADGTFLIDLLPATTTEVIAVLGTASVTRPVTIANGVTELGNLTLVNDPNPNPPGLPRTIEGTVRNAGGAVVANAIVQIRGAAQEQTVTDAAGNYNFYVPVGDYVIRVSGTGLNPVEVFVTVSNPAQPLRQDFTLTVQ